LFIREKELNSSDDSGDIEVIGEEIGRLNLDELDPFEGGSMVHENS